MVTLAATCPMIVRSAQRWWEGIEPLSVGRKLVIIGLTTAADRLQQVARPECIGDRLVEDGKQRREQLIVDT